jgi:diaminopimelate decarboxylase
MFNTQHFKKFNGIKTPFYYYNTALLKETLKSMLDAAPKAYHIHYALKANSNPKLLNIIKQHGIGADCVSGNEVKRALEIGFTNKQIAFAGV